MQNEPHKQLAHSWYEDAFAFVLGTGLCGFAVSLLTHLGLITGQTAGLAVLISYVSGWSFGAVFFVLNLPFYLLGWFQMGPRFTIKSFICVAMLSGFSALMPSWFVFGDVQVLPGALMAGAIVGLGLLALFRHGASLGGVGVLAYWLQDRMGVQAGWVQLGFDLVLFGTAIFLLDTQLVVFSLAGAVVLNLIIAVNHRRDRYVGR